jgi:hypothetical protein
VKRGFEFGLVVSQALSPRPLARSRLVLVIHNTQRIPEHGFNAGAGRREFGRDFSGEVTILNRKSGWSHNGQAPAAGVSPRGAAWEAVCSHTRQLGRSVADRGKLPATAARGFAASCRGCGHTAEIMDATGLRRGGVHGG